MAYNSENLAKVRREFETRHLKAESAAEARREELHRNIPELTELDREIARTGPRLMAIALHKSGETVDLVREDVRRLRRERGTVLRQHGYPEDYSDIRYACPVCQDSGYTEGRMCACMKRELVLAGYASSGILQLMDRCSLDNFSLEYYRDDPQTYANMEKAFRMIRNYVSSFSLRSPNLLFIGETGLGKTHLSVAIAKALIDKGYDVVYSGALGLFSDFENARFHNPVGTESGNSTDRYFTCELLIIDDLGTELTGQFTVSCLYDLINRRQNLGLPTIINTNLNYSELGQRYTDRIVSRLFGDFLPLQFVGTDVRRQKLMRD